MQPNCNRIKRQQCYQNMTSRSWRFVLPGSGEHHLQIEYIATELQRVFLDDIEISNEPFQEVFSGPNGIRLQVERLTSSEWALFVDEKRVEEVNGNGLRNLRNMAEGSYTIATGFEATSGFQASCQDDDATFTFMMDSVPQEVIVSYKDPAWNIFLNGEMVSQRSHTRIESQCSAEFLVMNSTGTAIPGRLDMIWKLEEIRYWSYQLVVGGTQVPATWCKAKASHPSVSMLLADPSEIPQICSGTEEQPEKVKDCQACTHPSPKDVAYNDFLQKVRGL
eukprot:gnl/MRDRNA2_/MRDRNA2_83650_c0_seq1.p1 gnl/MRDRNA2_/MRDRNA2_83650_c0~~gnl/MRDRNA2_/MRDRNA2_83650_c0_seq1.p1  ORF type:complete len:278 (+),score=47.48 gnl/MRDRNA2_/MRDRNA2_83650_c0_seq1:43-876(+)